MKRKLVVWVLTGALVLLIAAVSIFAAVLVDRKKEDDQVPINSVDQGFSVNLTPTPAPSKAQDESSSPTSLNSNPQSLSPTCEGGGTTAEPTHAELAPAKNPTLLPTTSPAPSTTPSPLATRLKQILGEDFNESSSPAQALELIEQQTSFSNGLSDNMLVQRFAILTFWFSTGGPTTWTIPSWGQPTDECTWNSITCNPNGQVTSIRVCCDGLSGILPPEIGLLTTTELFDMHSSAMLGGTIPSEVGLMTSLTWLDLNDLPGLSIGTIPTEIGNLVNLKFVGMFGTNLNGAVPSSSLGSLSNLEQLYLYTNSVSGTVPSSLCNHLTRALVDCNDVECDCCKQGVPFFNDGEVCAVSVTPTPPSPVPTPLPSTVNSSRTTILTDLIQAESPSSNLADELSAAYQAYQWMVNEDLFWTDDLSNERLVQRFALLTLWFSTGGAVTWSIPSWGQPTDECSWDAITCGADGRVLRIQLCCDGISGYLPAELGLLTHVELFDVHSSTMLGGSIPTEIGLMTSLTWLDMNDLPGLSAGTIPSQFSSLVNLKFLGMFGNKLEGPIPSSSLALLSNLEELYLYNNSLSGVVPTTLCTHLIRALVDCDDVECDCCKQGIPFFNDGHACGLDGTPAPVSPAPTTSPSRSTSRATMLADLVQSSSPSSNLTDTLSASYLAYQWMVNEDSFWLSNEDLSDTRSLQRFALVTFWYATGGPTTWIFDDEGWISSTNECTWEGIRCDDDSVVQKLWRSYRGLSNMIPREIGLLSGLTELDVEENMLQGRLPTEIVLLNSLTSLSVGNDYTGGENDITGLFDVVVNMPTLELFFCYDCGLSGSIPTEIGQMAGLKGFDLRVNSLSGSIPTEIGMCSNLTGFTVGDNGLSGPMPTELFSLSLNYLDVYGNDLTGSIPCDAVSIAAIDCGEIECGLCCVQGLGDGVTEDCSAT